MQRIIVPIDFSEESIKGLELGIIYANKFNADLQMVFVQKKKSGRFHIELRKQYDAAMEEFEDLLRKYKAKLHQNCDFSYIIKSGKVHEEVARQAEAFDDSLIICSTNGESGFSDFIIGSNAYKIVQATERPVITVTTEKYIGEVKRIVLPIDISKETREKVPVVAKIAKAFNSEVHIVKVTSSTSEGIHNKLRLYATQIKKFLTEQGISYQTTLLVGDNITDTIIEYATAIDADLTAIMTEQTFSLSNFLLGSYAYQMLNTSPVPVLSITPKGLYHTQGVRTTGG
ncbi:MAG: universal stress protein [Bacteroidales bacterium]|jgi:nucleotide-binding universal stress UspA family protein|nr:universal stress protein [Bacteroidales bacterium]MCK9499575.1 universal stress protein [Bacteroidales bacterium]MDY0315615.1 universal stress protein [Bacteroidales bacterium]NLB87594.1 universal stress protein [Bacteroidales bacterium]